ncbi:MAG: hypothetical protein QXY73_02555 [Candidatus Bathyarchaeia archaeon]|nr:hypothetical protein [Candidatus Bathyarchaeota archaeon]
MPVQRFSLSLTCKGAIFKAKRWFYATFYSRASDNVKELNKKAWAEFSRKIIEQVNSRGAADKPARLAIEYEVGPNQEFKPISAHVEVFEMKSIDSFKVPAPGVEPEEKAKLTAELEALIRKAKESGLSLEELLKQLRTS